jgi:hypothetical protein
MFFAPLRGRTAGFSGTAKSLRSLARSLSIEAERLEAIGDEVATCRLPALEEAFARALEAHPAVAADAEAGRLIDEVSVAIVRVLPPLAAAVTAATAALEHATAARRTCEAVPALAKRLTANCRAVVPSKKMDECGAARLDIHALLDGTNRPHGEDKAA